MVEHLITEHLDLWTSAHTTRSTSGRGSSNKLELTGIKKLRELILELAVRGKLVPQSPNDEPASSLLEKISKKKEVLIKEKVIKKPKKLTAVPEEDLPFTPPSSWEWVRLQDVTTYIQRGKGPTYADFGSVRVVSQKCVQWSGFNIEPARYVADESLEKYTDERFLKGGDLLWNSTGTGTVGRIAVLENIEEKSLVADSHVTVIRPLLVSGRFLASFISAPGIQGRIDPASENALVSGSTNQVELNTSAVAALEVPIPPLAEQKRIVHRLDELMALCDQLEQQTEASISAHQTLVETLLAILTDSLDADELAQNWARLAEHFDTLFTTEHSIEQLKQTILQLAVSGKLTEQDSGEESALTFYGRKLEIPADYDRSNKQKIKEKAISSIEDLPQLPPSWAYFTLDQLYKNNFILDYADGNHGSLYPRKNDFGDEGVLFLTATQIDDSGKVAWEECPRLKFENAKKLSKGWARQGDVFFTHNATVGRTAIALDPPEDDFLLGTSVTYFRINQKSIIPEFLYWYLTSASWKRQVEAVMRQTTRNQVSITKQALFFIALPPVAEQGRIVEKVNELMGICGHLLNEISGAADIQKLLSIAIVEHAVS